jgi:hypothetical protein
MNKFKKLYKDFFGLSEQAVKKTGRVVPGTDPKDATNLKLYNQELEKTQKLMKGMTEDQDIEIDEAKLINHLTDYKGGVEYVLRDPSQAQSVAEEIRQWSEKKGFNIIKMKISKSGKVGYFHFRLGQDPALESQKIQGYIAQKPEVKHFRFNVRGQQAAPTQSEPVANPPMRRNPNI